MRISFSPGKTNQFFLAVRAKRKAFFLHADAATAIWKYDRVPGTGTELDTDLEPDLQLVLAHLPLPRRYRQQLSNFPTRLILSLSEFFAKLLATNSSRNFCVKVHIENVPATNLLPPLRLFFFWFFRLWSMNCPKKKPKSSDRLDIRLLHSRCAASYIKTQKKTKRKK